jgi:abortive infection bacteriophage resistance protein
MKYTKPPLSFEQQADQLLDRGFVADRKELITRLKAVNYYRLSGYLYTYRNSDDTYREGTTLDEVWHRYTFDRRLRMLLLDGIERIEVAVRTRLAYIFSHEYGPFGYVDSKNLPNFPKDDYEEWREILAREFRRSREIFAKHFKDKYGDTHEDLPLWMAIELMPFGAALRMYGGVDLQIQRKVAAAFGYPEPVFRSWLKALNSVRNICAHHQRLWNRTLGIKPFIPRKNKYPNWHHPASVENDKVYSIITIIKCLISKIDSGSSWSRRMVDLMDEYPGIPVRWMGFPDGWRDSPLWRDVVTKK